VGGSKAGWAWWAGLEVAAVREAVEVLRVEHALVLVNPAGQQNETASPSYAENVASDCLSAGDSGGGVNPS
jgi:hypothetical protein